MWAMRLSLSSRIKWVGLDLPHDEVISLIPEHFNMLEGNAFSQSRVEIESVDDLHALNRVVFACFEKTIADRETTRNKAE